jgi:riboflavin synthase
MFTGIVQGIAMVREHVTGEGGSRLVLDFPASALDGASPGVSIAIDGICLTVVEVSGSTSSFDVVGETIARTTLGECVAGGYVNYERAAKYGGEIGGHEMSGHISTTAEIVEISNPDGNHVLTLEVAPEWMRYILAKGFIGLDGASLTVATVNPAGTFTVWLIPETLARTCFSRRQVGDMINIEIDAKTQAIVETVERYMEARE